MAGKKQSGMRHVRRMAVVVVILALALYFLPIVGLLYLACGILDVSRHRNVSFLLLQRYFSGNGMLTWFLSPLNLLADLFSHRNIVVYKLDDLPADHRSEIEACVGEFVANGPAIKAHIARSLAENRRGMLTFKWFNAKQTVDLRVAGFEREYRYIKTIAVSVFNTRQQTSWHFGPLRLTFRVLYNLEPIDSRDVFIEVDDRTHYWVDDPLFIFDDTAFHRSVNDVDHVRYCLFMDIVRPNYAHAAFEVALRAASAITSSFKRLFYRNWSFIR
ncbi:MAG: aspartyl/asparaginyl beta-hydroxylase domain-containing protein [Bauldia sp.]